MGRSLAFVPFDLGQPIRAVEAVEAIAASLPEGFDRVPDVFVHAAVAVEGDRASFARTNYLGPADLTEAIGRRMADRRSGRIALLVPQNARLRPRGAGDMAAPQGALWTWAEAFRPELAAMSPSATLTLVIPPRASSSTQRWLADRTGPRLGPADARPAAAMALLVR